MHVGLLDDTERQQGGHISIKEEQEIQHKKWKTGKHTVALAMAKLASPDTAFTLFSDLISRLTLCSGSTCSQQFISNPVYACSQALYVCQKM